MSADNGLVEVSLDQGRKTSFRRCATRLELAELSSVLGELVQAQASYAALSARWKTEMEADGTSDARRIEAFKASTDLDRVFRERTLPLFGRLLDLLTPRAVSGVPVTDYGLDDTILAATQFVIAHRLTEDERKNA